jgi:mono/diheme cytochrome c family protein
VLASGLLLVLAIAGGAVGRANRDRVLRALHRYYPRHAVGAEPKLKLGESVFARSCAAGYCHGPRGSGGGAPKLAGRGLDEAYIANAVSGGISGSSMPGFSADLSPAELTSVVAFVARLNGVSVSASDKFTDAPAPKRGPTGDAARGRDLFRDAVRGFGRCSTCHEANGIGIPVTPPFSHIPASVAALHELQTPSVQDAVLNGDRMPALLLNRTGTEVTFYDLTVAPPVLRYAAPEAVSFSPGTQWKHSTAITAYSDSELNSILTYLRAPQ